MFSTIKITFLRCLSRFRELIPSDWPLGVLGNILLTPTQLFHRESRLVLQLPLPFANLPLDRLCVFGKSAVFEWGSLADNLTDTERGYYKLDNNAEAQPVHYTMQVSFYWGNGSLDIVRIDPPAGSSITSFQTRFCPMTAEEWHQGGVSHVAASEIRNWVAVRLARALLVGGWTGEHDLACFSPPIPLSDYPSYVEISTLPPLLRLLRAPSGSRLSVLGFGGSALGWVPQDLPELNVASGYRVERRCVLQSQRTSRDMRVQAVSHHVGVDSLFHMTGLGLALQMASLYTPHTATVAEIQSALLSPPPSDFESLLRSHYPRSHQLITPYRPGKPTAVSQSRPVFPSPSSLILVGFAGGWEEMDRALALLVGVTGLSPVRVVYDTWRLQLWYGDETSASLAHTRAPTMPELAHLGQFLATGHALNPREQNHLIQLLNSRPRSPHLPSLPPTLLARITSFFPGHPDDSQLYSPSTPNELGLPWLGATSAPTWDRDQPKPASGSSGGIFTSDLEHGTIRQSQSYSWRPPPKQGMLRSFRRGDPAGELAHLPCSSGPPPPPSIARPPPPPSSEQSAPQSHPPARPGTYNWHLNPQQKAAGREPPVAHLPPPAEWPGRPEDDRFPIYRVVRAPGGLSWPAYQAGFGQSWHESGGNSDPRYLRQRTRRTWAHVLHDLTLVDEALYNLNVNSYLLGNPSSVTTSTIAEAKSYLSLHRARLLSAPSPSAHLFSTPTQTTLNSTQTSFEDDSDTYDHAVALAVQAQLDRELGMEGGASSSRFVDQSQHSGEAVIESEVNAGSVDAGMGSSGEEEGDPPGWVREAEEEAPTYVGNGKSRA